jgi:Subtilase family
LSGLTLLTSLAHAVKPDGAIAPIHRAANPITDAQGRIETIVDFDFDPKSDIEFDHGVSPENERKWDKHQGKVINLLDHYEKKYGFTRSGMTSWAKVSATAFLAVDQIEKLSKDKRVLLLTENTRIDLSAPPPWGNAYVGSEYRSWGFSATNGKVGYSSASGRTVYIIDSGVALHTDLPGVVSRVNMACGNSLTNCSNGSTTDAYPVVGCYPHATHVAGIIGAKGGNGLTSAGVYDAARMVSVAVGSATGTNVGKCNTGITTGAVGYAIDFVYRQVLGAPPSYLNNGVAIANISINSGSFGYASNGTAETNRAALLRLATPDPNLYSYSPSTGWKSTPYPGAFIAQSAGNIVNNGNNNDPAYGNAGKNICSEYQIAPGLPKPSFAYTHAVPNNNTTNPTDGIMVVGAIHHDGKAVNLNNGSSPSLPFSGVYDSTGLRASVDHSSNYGPCVDIWAPGNLIYSTFGLHSDLNGRRSIVGVTYSGSGISSTVTQGWVFLSGTSMAAPHVAGAAAYLADAFGLTTPAQIEQKVRQYATSTGYADMGGNLIKIVQLP